MMAFFDKEYLSYGEVFGVAGAPYTSPPTTDLSYNHKPLAIGIDYGGISGLERLYVYTLVRWMALKIGKKRRVFREPSFRSASPVPYMLYDESDTWPVLDQPKNAGPANVGWCCVDKYGVLRTLHEKTMRDLGLFDDIDVTKIRGQLRAEMKRLDKAWTAWK
jgi:hypothetical protein